MYKLAMTTGITFLFLMLTSSAVTAGGHGGNGFYYEGDGMDRHAVWKEFLHDRGQLPEEEQYIRTIPKVNQESKTAEPVHSGQSNNSSQSGYYYQGDGLNRHAVWKEYLHDRGQLPDEERYVKTSPEENREATF